MDKLLFFSVLKLPHCKRQKIIVSILSVVVGIQKESVGKLLSMCLPRSKCTNKGEPSSFIHNRYSILDIGVHVLTFLMDHELLESGGRTDSLLNPSITWPHTCCSPALCLSLCWGPSRIQPHTHCAGVDEWLVDRRERLMSRFQRVSFIEQH